MSNRNIIKLLESRKGNLDDRLKQDYVSFTTYFENRNRFYKGSILQCWYKDHGY